MRFGSHTYCVNSLEYIIRSAEIKDARQLSTLRLQIDGETENLDREQGEGYLSEANFEKIINTDAEETRNLFLIAVTGDRITGYSRCQGNSLKRCSHRVEFGVCVSKAYWGYGIGKNLLKSSISWAQANEIRKISLNVLETNIKAVELYKKLGFEEEGLLKKDKLLSDGKFYNTIIMSKFL